MARPFLTARWRNLLNRTYTVPVGLVDPHCPDGLELELSDDGRAFVSLVAFEFVDTRLRGIPVPGHRAFPEVNLRFYVRHGDNRGVVFLREFVPRRAVAWLARALYAEPYERVPMTSNHAVERGTLSFSLRFDAGGRSHEIDVTADSRSTNVPSEDSTAHFFKEHTWGFGTDRRGRTRRYRVDHPRWAVYEIDALTLDVDFGAIYGEEWAILDDADPVETLFAAGSDVAVSRTEVLDTG